MSNEKEDPIKHRLFADVPSSDRFFDSLREAYPGFDDWYLGKAASGERDGLLLMMRVPSSPCCI